MEIEARTADERKPVPPIVLLNAKSNARSDVLTGEETMPIYRGDFIFTVDWTDLNAVKRVCDLFGKGNVVIKVPSRPNFNITHESRADPKQIVYRPIGEATC